jgi:hypothetical protein
MHSLVGTCTHTNVYLGTSNEFHRYPYMLKRSRGLDHDLALDLVVFAIHIASNPVLLLQVNVLHVSARGRKLNERAQTILEKNSSKKINTDKRSVDDKEQ